MPTLMALTDTDIRIRTATQEDGDTLVELIALVDLQLRAEELPGALDPMRHALTDSDDGPLSHRRNHFLIAENSKGAPVGAIACGHAKWMSDPNRSPKIMHRRIVERITTVHGLAVVPTYRNQGIARALLQHAEQTFRDAGYTALTLRHERSLTKFYGRLGYTSHNRLSLKLPTGELLSLVDRGWKHAFKVLTPTTSITTVQGMPTITGALSD
ncbi:GNAT family N-acetyltransferase (plasmid) [Streptomyces sp. BB1-1-1]|uniref:GNAT family N-acetyltransferase n=1 Tax=Streptomyces sp. BB1-1-1 TaxID=3074430 RepID=UPI002878008F|nr:GNAT family N-acetyltransferase [Streptomyces sp. BB1-1-1]WND40800.1 GNAT family N-acetyltransferase [Streptomyces sp. BB1-1-1]